MKINLHSEPDNRERLMIQLSEFSFAAYPVQINHGFRCLPDAASSPDRIAQPAAKRVEPADFPVAPLGVRKANGSAGCRQYFTGASRPMKNLQDELGHGFGRSNVNDLLRVPEADCGQPMVLPSAAKEWHARFRNKADSAVLPKLCLPIFRIFRNWLFASLEIETAPRHWTKHKNYENPD